MEYFLEFHWWYIFVALIALFFINGKGGIVVKRFSANLQLIDDRFKDCIPEATYSMFKEGNPHKIDIEIDRLPLEVGEVLAFELNGALLANAKVKRDKEAEFEHWSDEDVYFPEVKAGDELVIKYKGREILKGTFQLEYPKPSTPNL